MPRAFDASSIVEDAVDAHTRQFVNASNWIKSCTGPLGLAADILGETDMFDPLKSDTVTIHEEPWFRLAEITIHDVESLRDAIRVAKRFITCGFEELACVDDTEKLIRVYLFGYGKVKVRLVFILQDAPEDECYAVSTTEVVHTAHWVCKDQ